MHDHAGNSSLPNKQIRAASNDEERQIFPVTKTNQLRKCILGPRLDPKLCRPAHPQRGVLREWLEKPDVAFRAHDFLQSFRDHQLSGERGQLLVHVAGAETQNEVAFREHASHISVQTIEAWLIRNSAVPMR